MVTVMLVRVVTVMNEREVTVRVFIGCAIRGSAEKWQIHTQWSHFLRLAVTMDFDDISIQKYGQLIINSLSCSSLSVL